MSRKSKPFWEIDRELFIDSKFYYWAHLKSTNGKIVHTTETYPTKRLARKAIAVMERAYDREPGFVEIRDMTKAKP